MHKDEDYKKYLRNEDLQSDEWDFSKNLNIVKNIKWWINENKKKLFLLENDYDIEKNMFDGCIMSIERWKELISLRKEWIRYWEELLVESELKRKIKDLEVIVNENYKILLYAYECLIPPHRYELIEYERLLELKVEKKSDPLYGAGFFKI